MDWPGTAPFVPSVANALLKPMHEAGDERRSRSSGAPAEEDGGISFLASARTSISAPKYSSLAAASCFILGMERDVGGCRKRLSTSVFCNVQDQGAAVQHPT